MNKMRLREYNLVRTYDALLYIYSLKLEHNCFYQFLSNISTNYKKNISFHTAYNYPCSVYVYHCALHIIYNYELLTISIKAVHTSLNVNAYYYLTMNKVLNFSESFFGTQETVSARCAFIYSYCTFAYAHFPLYTGGLSIFSNSCSINNTCYSMNITANLGVEFTQNKTLKMFAGIKTTR